MGGEVAAQGEGCGSFPRRQTHSEMAIVLHAMVSQVLGRILRGERTASLRCPIIKQQRAANAEVIVNLKTFRYFCCSAAPGRTAVTPTSAFDAVDGSSTGT